MTLVQELRNPLVGLSRDALGLQAPLDIPVQVGGSQGIRCWGRRAVTGWATVACLSGLRHFSSLQHALALHLSPELLASEMGLH